MELDQAKIEKIIATYLESSGFTQRKLTDSPSDNLQSVNRKYVNFYCSISTLPQTSVIGQQVFLPELGYPVYRNTSGKWVTGTGSVIA